MLKSLTITDYVIVDRLELDFESGFTVLTGETGAGKSILVDALSLALGERAEAGVVRAGRERAEVTAQFDIDRLPAVAQWLRQGDLEANECLLRRVIDTGGRSRAFINGVPVTLQQLRELGDLLVDIQGQHAHLSLLKPASQRGLLDAYGGLAELARQVTAAWHDWQAAKKARETWAANAEAFTREAEQLAWQIKEVTALEYTPEGWGELLAEHGRLAHAANLLEGAQFALDALSEGEGACLARVNAVADRLRDLAEYDSAVGEIGTLIDSAEVQLREAVYGLRHYAQKVELDPARLQEVEDRLQAVHDCVRKYRVTPEALPDLLGGWRLRLEDIGGGGDGAGLQAREAAALESYRGLASRLSAGRKQAAAELSNRVTGAMQKLAMKGGRFEVALNSLAEGASYGMEQPEFLVAVHGGETRPLARTASGGELSRISLAIQVSAIGATPVPTLIFDEVDVGIGGGVAEIVGKMLNDVAGGRQVLCITHLPQVAARGQHHLCVSKVGGKEIFSRIAMLVGAERVEEVARMLGGEKITETTRRHAAEMLGYP
jgi:DNA repair protein RecN (Recombination protein N)